MDTTTFLNAAVFVVLNMLVGFYLLQTVYRIIFTPRQFENSSEKAGFYIHGWASYLAVLVLIFSPVLSMTAGCIGLFFLVVLRILIEVLKSKRDIK